MQDGPACALCLLVFMKGSAAGCQCSERVWNGEMIRYDCIILSAAADGAHFVLILHCRVLSTTREDSQPAETELSMPRFTTTTATIAPHCLQCLPLKQSL
jgi:hypothetical protein